MKNNKLWYEKVSIWITIIAGICAILTFIFSNIISDNREINNSDKTDDGYTVNGSNNIVIYGSNNGDISINAETSSETEMLESKVASPFNFGEAMQNIYNNEKIINDEIINNQKAKPIYSSIYPGVSYYHISNKVRLIEVTNGFSDIECSRAYYFDENEKLSFSLICDNKGEHRLYFCDNILIRYIDENGDYHDITNNLDTYECKWTELVQEESYEIFNGVKKTSESDDFSVVAWYDMDTIQSSREGIDVLVKAKTSFPAAHVTISAISDENETIPADMHGGTREWYFKANFYIKGTYTITITAYNSEGESVSDKFTYVY